MTYHIVPRTSAQSTHLLPIGVPLFGSLLVLCLFLITPGYLRCQELSLHSTSNVVLVPALVTDAAGHPIYGLSAEDFIVQDNGVVQNIQLDESFSLAPVSLVVAIDRGQGNAVSFERLRGLGGLLEPIVGDGKGEVAVVTFDTGVKLAHDFTPDTSTVKTCLKELKPGDGGDAIVDAMHFALNLLEARPKDHRKMLLIIGETRDHGSLTKLDDLIPQVERSNTLIYTAAFSPTLSSLLSNPEPPRSNINLLAIVSVIREAAKENVLKTIAQLSGGEYLPFGSERGFEDRLTEMGNHVHNLYLLSFQPRKLIPGQHSIRVRLRGRDDPTVYARSGYWASQERR